MNNEIDSLSLKIEVKGLSKKQIENIRDLTKYLRLLHDTLKVADFSKLDDFIWSSMGAGDSLSALAKGISKLNKAIQELDVEKLKALPTIQIFNFDNKAIDNGTRSIEAQTKAQEDLTNAIKETQKAKRGAKGTTFGAETKQAIKEAKKEEKEVTEDGKHKTSYFEKPGALTKLFRRIKLIAFIKLIRGALNAIIKGFQSGIQSLAIYSKDFNNTMSQMTTNLEKIRGSIALISQPVMEALLPAIEAISEVLINVANSISRANAQMKGMTTYTKINANYAKDYAQSMQKGSLFSFDTFETLSEQNTPYETASVEAVDDADNLVNIITDIKEIGDTLGKTFKTVLPYVTQILDTISPILDVIIDISNEATNDILPSVAQMLNLVVSVLKLVSPLVKNIFKQLEPIISAVNNDLLPSVTNLLEAIIKPIAEIIGELPIGEIVGFVANLLVPAIKFISDIIQTISNVVTPLFEIIKNVIDPFVRVLSPVFELVKKTLSDITTGLTDFFNVFGDIFNIIIALFQGDTGKAGEAFDKLVQDFARSMGNAVLFVLRAIVGFIETIVNMVIESINNIITFFPNLFGADLEGPITWRANWSENMLPSFANGGIVGEVWQMNEYGNPEMLYNSNGGSTAVITQAQLAQAFEQAIYNTGILDAISDGKAVYIDGKSIAQSKSFKNELNRTNPNLGLR